MTFKKSEHALSHTTLAKEGQNCKENLKPKRGTEANILQSKSLSKKGV